MCEEIFKFVGFPGTKKYPLSICVLEEEKRKKERKIRVCTHLPFYFIFIANCNTENYKTILK